MIKHIPGQVTLPASALMERAATPAAEECATAVTGGKCSDDLDFTSVDHLSFPAGRVTLPGSALRVREATLGEEEEQFAIDVIGESTN